MSASVDWRSCFVRRAEFAESMNLFKPIAAAGRDGYSFGYRPAIPESREGISGSTGLIRVNREVVVR
jgi:hypothetical protein